MKPEYRFNYVARENDVVHLEVMKVVENGWIIKHSEFIK